MQRAGQNFNSAGIALFARMWWVRCKPKQSPCISHLYQPQGERHLAIPHLDVADIRSINWQALKVDWRAMQGLATHCAYRLQASRDAFLTRTTRSLRPMYRR